VDPRGGFSTAQRGPERPCPHDAVDPLQPVALLVVTVLATASLQGCAASTTNGPRFCNVSSAGCMALKAQQSKTGTIAGQQGRCCG
jgi:hypothetical protein